MRNKPSFKNENTYYIMPDGITKCDICGYKYLTDYIRYHEDRCGIKVNGKRILDKDDKKKRIK